MPNSKVNINMTSGSNKEQVTVVIAVLINTSTGLPASVDTLNNLMAFY